MYVRSMFALLTLGILVSAARAQDNWPRFRGANADSVAADDKRLPESWSKTENVKWVVWRLLLHAAGSGLSDVPRCADGPGNLRKNSLYCLSVDGAQAGTSE
jgi:hypothetical protein